MPKPLLETDGGYANTPRKKTFTFSFENPLFAKWKIEPPNRNNNVDLYQGYLMYPRQTAAESTSEKYPLQTAVRAEKLPAK